MTPEMFERLIRAIDSTDWIDHGLQLGGIIVPIIFALWISWRDSKRLKVDVENKNRILDERQQKLETIQTSIAENISELTKQQNQLSKTQEKVEENLRELKELAQQSRKSNQLTMQVHYKEFFEKHKSFKKALRKIEEFYELYQQVCPDSMSPEVEMKYEVLRNSTTDDKIYEFQFLDEKNIPPIVFDDFSKLKDFLQEIDSKRVDTYDEYFENIYPKLKEFDMELNRLLS
ncbi:hypothetical protein [Streptococcus oralis]|jgi:hypothetical protein|uniref:Uncharacterized protein n=1 Tax=Streptococcus oralis TaxID=1303 RepID=A0A139PPB3_STROR|nr:hypothetical protein [Streptococcus oralis]KXT91852.1 hypothetical protein SORDD21_00603 [Streptococcus oralis]MCY7074691.1 hypothetical protein [Streptococcus oralis]